MASPEEALQSTNAKANFQRLTRLLMRGGVALLRETFDSIHSPANLPTTLSTPAVQALLRSARLTRLEWDCLYPSPGVYGKSTDFDITLTFRLLRTICNLTPPATGWDDLPNSADLRLEADLARIKYYRNEVYGHSKTMELTDAEFDDLWREISEALVRIAAHLSHVKRDEWKKAIDKFLRNPLTPEEERCVEELSEWYKHDMDVKDAVEKLEKRFQEIRGLREKKDVDVKNAVQQLGATLKESNQELQQELRDLWEVTRQLQQSVVILLKVNGPGSPCLHQAAGGYEGMRSSREIQGNQQDLPTEIDMWNVIVSFKNSFNLFLHYLRSKLDVVVIHLDMGSLRITVGCRSLQILEELWHDYRSGHLNQIAQDTLITAEILETLELTKLTLKTFISEEQYKKGKQIFMDNSDHRGHSKVRLEDTTKEGTLRAVLTFGQLGSADGMLDTPCGVAVNDKNEIAVTEIGNQRVSVFSSDGTHLRSFGRHGRKQGEFNYPTGIAFDNNGNIIVADYHTHRVQVFTGNGKFVREFAAYGCLDHQLIYPQGLSVASNGDIIVADSGNKLIKIFSPSGQFLRKFGGKGSLQRPYHCIQTEQYLIVSDSCEHCIKVFDLQGNLKFKFGKEGSKEGEFNVPRSLSISKSGHLIVCDSGNNRLQVFEQSGKFVTMFGTEGSETGEFNCLVSTANLSDGRIVVTDQLNNRIQMLELL